MCFDLHQFDRLFPTGSGHYEYEMTYTILAVQHRQAVVRVDEVVIKCMNQIERTDLAIDRFTG